LLIGLWGFAATCIKAKQQHAMAKPVERGLNGLAVNWLSVKNSLGSDDEQLFKQICEDHEEAFDEFAKQHPEENKVSLKDALRALIFKSKPKDPQYPGVYLHALRILCLAFGESLEMTVYPVDQALIEEVDKKIARSDLAGKFSLARLSSTLKPPFDLAKPAEWPKAGFFAPDEVSAVRAVLKGQTPAQLAAKIMFGKADSKDKHSKEEEAQAQCLESALQWFQEDAGCFSHAENNLEDDGDPETVHEGEDPSSPNKRGSVPNVLRSPSLAASPAPAQMPPPGPMDRKDSKAGDDTKEPGRQLRGLTLDDTGDDPTALIEITGSGSNYQAPVSPTALLSPKSRQAAFAEEEEHERLKFPFGSFGIICFYT